MIKEQKNKCWHFYTILEIVFLALAELLRKPELVIAMFPTHRKTKKCIFHSAVWGCHRKGSIFSLVLRLFSSSILFVSIAVLTAWFPSCFSFFFFFASKIHELQQEQNCSVMNLSWVYSCPSALCIWILALSLLLFCSGFACPTEMESLPRSCDGYSRKTEACQWWRNC